MSENDITRPELPRLLIGTEEACRMLSISKPTLLGFIHRPVDPLPCLRIGRAIRIDCRKLGDWVSRQTAGEV